MKNKRCAAEVLSVALVALGVAATAQAKPPPVEFALQAVGEGADYRADSSWRMSYAGDDGIASLCVRSVKTGDDGRARFSGDGKAIEAKEGAKVPWNLLWAVLWSEEPENALSEYRGDWTDENARVEVADGEPVNCWGDDSKMCVDEQNRRIEVLELDVDGVAWGIYLQRDGTRVQISRDGAQFARLVQGGC